MNLNIDEAFGILKKELNSSPGWPQIMKVIHFGSTIKGNAEPNSDIDVLIISSDGDAVRNSVANAAFSLQMNYGIPIEPIIESLDDYIYPNSYFLYNVINYGKDVYSVSEDRLNKEIRETKDRLEPKMLISS